MRTAQPSYKGHSSYAPKAQPTEGKATRQKRDTSVDWVTIPRLSFVTIVAFVLTLVFNGV